MLFQRRLRLVTTPLPGRIASWLLQRQDNDLAYSDIPQFIDVVHVIDVSTKASMCKNSGEG